MLTVSSLFLLDGFSANSQGITNESDTEPQLDPPHSAQAFQASLPHLSEGAVPR